MTAIVAVAAAAWVTSYLAWALWRSRSERVTSPLDVSGSGVHPGEWWVVLAHAVAFASAYVLGASNASFLLVLAVHHEVQYLYFTCAIARRSAGSPAAHQAGMDAPAPDFQAQGSQPYGQGLRTKAGQAAAFMVWPFVGFVGAMVGGWLQLGWLAPLGMGGLFCHYWLDGRIWTRPSLPA